MEPELIAMTTNLSKFASINPTWAIRGKKLYDGFSRISTDFLLNIHVIEIWLNDGKIKVKMDYLQKYVVIAYFFGKHLLT